MKPYVLRARMEELPNWTRIYGTFYRIFLTRGILGTFVYCEDDETQEFLRSLCP